MNIEWEVRILHDSGRMGVLAKVPTPSNLRQIASLGRATPVERITAALYQQDEDGTYRVAFIPAIRQHFDIPHATLKTERGARRRIRKYVELWAIAGYPRAFGGER